MNIYWSLLTIIPTVHWKPLASTGQHNLHPILLAIILCVIMLWKIYLPTPPWKHGVRIKMTKNLFRQGNPVFLFLPQRGEKAWRSTPCPRRSIINERHDSNDEICQPVCRTLTCRTWQYQPCFLWDWLPTWCPIDMVFREDETVKRAEIFTLNVWRTVRYVEWYSSQLIRLAR